MSQVPFNVVDPRLAAGRGEDFSASKQKELLEEAYGKDGSRRMPIDHRVEDSLETDGLQMASVHTAISENNVGFQMLQRMGWKGQGLGSKEDGIQEPVGGGTEAGVRLGLGKQEEDKFYTAADNIQRKRLETEIQATEDETRSALREVEAERGQRIKEDVSMIMRTFFCEALAQVCHKQYAFAAEMEVHLSSYDHHHKKRLLEMRREESERTRTERDKREKRRQEKELLRLNSQIKKARGSNDLPPLPSEAQPPLPPENDGKFIPGNAEAEPGTTPEGGQGLPPSDLPSTGFRSAVQFNMGASKLNKAIPRGLAFQPPSTKKVTRPKPKVIGFSGDSDDE